VPETSGTLDGVAIKIAGKKHWLWRAVDRKRSLMTVAVSV
jgi:transposase-like protein